MTRRPGWRVAARFDAQLRRALRAFEAGDLELTLAAMDTARAVAVAAYDDPHRPAPDNLEPREASP